MARIVLKNIIGKRTIAHSIVTDMAEQLGITAWVEDNNGITITGNAKEHPEAVFPVSLENEVLGFVKGDAKAAIIAQVLICLAEKEAEKKKIGAEVLHLYQEVNLMFDFSDKLAKTIGAAGIADTTLKEASRVIKSDSGAIILQNERNKSLQVMASSGIFFSNEEEINNVHTLIHDLLAAGQSTIFDDISNFAVTGVLSAKIRSMIFAPLKVNQRVLGAIILGFSDEIQYSAADLKLLTSLAFQSSAAIESALLYEKNISEAREREETMRRVYEATTKFVPYEFIRSLGHEVITDVKLGDQVEKIVTVLFSDIREYTSIAEQMTPAENFRFVCSFNEQIGPFIRKHNGFVNQYLGDSIMAIFPGNAADALAAAIDMQKEVERFNTVRQVNDQSPIQIGIGMHTGPLIMGITGDNERMDACTISDTVNTASRLEGLTKHYKAGIILSQASLEQIANKENFHLRNLGLVQLKGKQELLKIHECFSNNTDHDTLKKVATLPLFNEAVSHYLDNSFEQANEVFQKISIADPADRTAQFFFQHTKQILETGLPQSKTGVVEMREK